MQHAWSLIEPHMAATAKSYCVLPLGSAELSGRSCSCSEDWQSASARAQHFAAPSVAPQLKPI